MRATTAVPEIPARWPQVQCETCKIVFTLSPLDEPAGLKAMDLLQEELYGHIRRRHIDLPSDPE